MKLEQYRKETLRTMPDLGSRTFDSLHMTVGMITELGEINDALETTEDMVDIVNLSEEIADLRWYMSNYANLYSFEFKDTPQIPCSAGELIQWEDYEDAYFDMMKYTILLLDMDKKSFAYGKSFQTAYRIDIFTYLNNAFLHFAKYWSIDLEEAMELNIAKLRARFPDKFDTDKAINRDLDVERKILEGNIN